MYFERSLSQEINLICKDFKALFITGARQIGKTTLLKHLGDSNRKYVSLDNKTDLLLARTDPQGFLDTYSPPVIIDEIQYAPELFPYIKILLDNSDKKDLIWMTGSGQYSLMQNITESLAGRIAIVQMYNFSLYEQDKKAHLCTPFLPSATVKKELKKRSIDDTFKLIWQGMFPEVISKEEKSRNIFYESYVQTYLERDVRQLINLKDELHFLTFLKVLAGRTGQILDYTDIARNVGVSPNNIKNWISVLRTSGLIYLLQPYYKNITKRFTKTPKLYFMDTGLASYLAGWTTSQSLQYGISSGAFFETFVISEIIKSYQHNLLNPNIYFFKDEKKNEIDLLIQKNGMFYPVEIKKHSTPSINDISAFKIFSKLEHVEYGCEICLTPEPQALSPTSNAISIWNI